jgi:hypothetical protein
MAISSAQLDGLWRDAGVERVRKVLAAHLLHHHDPDAGAQSITTSKAANVVRQQLGPNWRAVYSAGVAQLKDMLLQDSHQCFRVEELCPGEKAIRLDLLRLQLAVQQQQQQQQAAAQSAIPSQSSGSPPAAAAGPAAGDEASPLAAAIGQRWGSQGAASVLRALALHMIGTPDPPLGNYTLTATQAGQFLAKSIGSNWKDLAGVKKEGSVRHLISSSLAGGCFVVTQHGPSDFAIRLSTETLLGQAGRGSSSSSSHGSMPAAGHHGDAAATPLSPAAAANTVGTGTAAAAAANISAAAAPVEAPAAEGLLLVTGGHSGATCASQSEAPGEGASTEPTAAAHNKQLLAAIKQKWPLRQRHRGYAGVLRVLAEQLVQQADPEVTAPYTMRMSYANKVVARLIEGSWRKALHKKGKGSPLELLLASRADGHYFTVHPGPQVVTDKCAKVVSLDTQALLAAAGGTSNSSASSSSNSSSGSDGGVSRSPPAEGSIQPGPIAGPSYVSGARQVQQHVQEQTVTQPGPSGSRADVMAAARAAAVAAYRQLLLQAQQQHSSPPRAPAEGPAAEPSTGVL